MEIPALLGNVGPWVPNHVEAIRVPAVAERQSASLELTTCLLPPNTLLADREVASPASRER